MGSRKSQDPLLVLLENVLDDISANVEGFPQSDASRDFDTICSRVEREGVQFLTKTLPKLGRAIDEALCTGSLTVPSEFGRYAKLKVRWNIPRLFSALFRLIFTPSGNLIGGRADIIAHLRQLCYLYYKLELPFTQEQLDAAERKFVENDFACGVSMETQRSTVAKAARFAIRDVLKGFDPRQIRPCHGPGAVADRLHGREKWLFNYYSARIDRLYPYSNFITGGVFSEKPNDVIRHVSFSRKLIPARVCFVPKDSKGPRVISAEPAILQYLQQGLGRALMEFVETRSCAAGQINFTDQTINRQLAKSSSLDGRFATLDLSDASDLVSTELVKVLFPEYVTEYLMALRSEEAVLPSGRIVRLKKYAPMGSALCFPVEALCFYAIALAAIRVKTRKWRKHLRSVFVYGDDIIVPTEHATDVVVALEAFGLRVNRRKSCFTGNFRESCGMDAYQGVDVTPVRVRHSVALRGHRSVAGCYRLVENANAFFDKAYWRAARYLDELCEGIVAIPYLRPSNSGMRRTSSILPVVPHNAVRRWNRNLQKVEVKRIGNVPITISSPFPTGEQRLVSDLFYRPLTPITDDVAVHRLCALKAGWEELH